MPGGPRVGEAEYTYVQPTASQEQSRESWGLPLGQGVSALDRCLDKPVMPKVIAHPSGQMAGQEWEMGHS